MQAGRHARSQDGRGGGAGADPGERCWALGATGASRARPPSAAPGRERVWPRGAGALTAQRPCGTRATRASPRRATRSVQTGRGPPPCSDASPRSERSEPRFHREGHVVSGHGQDAAAKKVEPFWQLCPLRGSTGSRSTGPCVATLRALRWLRASTPSRCVRATENAPSLAAGLAQEVTEREQVVYGTRALGRGPARNDTRETQPCSVTAGAVARAQGPGRGPSGKEANGVWKRHFLCSGSESKQNGSRARCRRDSATSPVVKTGHSGPRFSPRGGAPSSLASPT